MRRPYCQKKSGLAIALGSILALGLFSLPSFASNFNSNLRQGLPGRRISGGSRSIGTACIAHPEQPIIALMPESNLGLTISARPTFWFAMPEVHQSKNIEFGIFNQNEELIYQKTFQPSGEAGITHFSLPETEAALAIDQEYRWYLTVICDPSSRAEDLVVTGWVRRITPESALVESLAEATQQEQVALYQDAELWHETITQLADLYRNIDPDSTASQTGTVEQQWNALLEAVNLPQVTETPFSNQSNLGLAVTLPASSHASRPE
ncbi:MAG: DUF928 domain-containing protein [Cyanobacteria bacterium J06627_28]